MQSRGARGAECPTTPTRVAARPSRAMLLAVGFGRTRRDGIAAEAFERLERLIEGVDCDHSHAVGVSSRLLGLTCWDHHQLRAALVRSNGLLCDAADHSYGAVRQDLTGHRHALPTCELPGGEVVDDREREGQSR